MNRRQHRKFPEVKVERQGKKPRRIKMGRRPDRALERRLDAAARQRTRAKDSGVPRIKELNAAHAANTQANVEALGGT